MASKRHVQTLVFCHKRQKCVPKGEEYDRAGNPAPYIQGPLEPFKSPITGEIISSREQLRRHHREHGTTDSRDYSPEFLEKRAAERHQRAIGAHPDDRKDRIERLKRAVYEGK